VFHKLRFLAQAGGHGCTTTCNVGPSDVLIDLRGLPGATTHAEAITEAGALTGDVVMEAKTYIGSLNCDK
jgi:hypothetical protein